MIRLLLLNLLVRCGEWIDRRAEALRGVRLVAERKRGSWK